MSADWNKYSATLPMLRLAADKITARNNLEVIMFDLSAESICYDHAYLAANLLRASNGCLRKLIMKYPAKEVYPLVTPLELKKMSKNARHYHNDLVNKCVYHEGQIMFCIDTIAKGLGFSGRQTAEPTAEGPRFFTWEVQSSTGLQWPLGR
jgi:hypothetical protein